MDFAERKQRLHDLCSELNDAEQQLAREMAAAHDEGCTVNLEGSFCYRRVLVFGPSYPFPSREGKGD